MKNIIAINGSFLLGKITGMERFAIETVKELDRICNKDEYEIVVPNNPVYNLTLANIPIIIYGSKRGMLWSQTAYCWYVIRNHRIPLSLTSIIPIIKPGIVCIHDITFKVNKVMFNYSFRSRLSRIWRNFQYYLCFKYCPIIFTVSEFSKKEILSNYCIDEERLVVIGNGWNHFERIVPNDLIRKKHPEYFKKPFFFALGSLAENKNIKWIMKTAQYHPSYNFLIAGGKINKYGSIFDEESIPNVYFLGYISDSEVKYIMSQAKAFLFPSIYEGFGIPPLEALSVGTEIIISDTSCLPEIYQDCAHYIDPYYPCMNLDAVLSYPVCSCEKLLKKYTWRRCAHILYSTLTTFKEDL